MIMINGRKCAEQSSYDEFRQTRLQFFKVLDVNYIILNKTILNIEQTNVLNI